MLYHISHIDLDGYGCHYVTSKVFTDIKFINANYNKSIEDTLVNLFSELSLLEDPSIHEILITDINISESQALMVDTFSNFFKVKVTLLDHHGTGKPSGDKYHWYHLVEDVCATNLTYQYFYPILENKLDVFELKNLDYLVDSIDSYDMWREDSPLFSKGKLLNSLILDNKSRFSKLIDGEIHKYIFFMFSELGRQISMHPVSYIEKNFYDISKSFLKNKISDTYFYNEDHTLGYLFNRYVFESVDYSLFPIVELNGLTGRVFTDMYGGLFQDFSHFYLNEISDTSFVVHISERGQLSFRSVGDVDVSFISQKYFGGGGHPNAAGGSLGERLSNVKIPEALSLIEKAKKKVNKDL